MEQSCVCLIQCGVMYGQVLFSYCCYKLYWFELGFFHSCELLHSPHESCKLFFDRLPVCSLFSVDQQYLIKVCKCHCSKLSWNFNFVIFLKKKNTQQSIGAPCISECRSYWYYCYFEYLPCNEMVVEARACSLQYLFIFLHRFNANLEWTDGLAYW